MGQNRDVISITNQAGFCDDVLGTIADAVGTGGDFQACQSGPGKKMVHQNTVFINDK